METLISRFVGAFGRSLGQKRYALGGICVFALTLYEVARARVNWLPDISAWEIAIFVILVIIVVSFWGRVVFLEKKIEPQLVIEFEEQYPFEYEQPPIEGGLCFRHYSIRIRNIGGQKLSDCFVKISDLIDEAGEQYVHIPVPLTKRGTFKTDDYQLSLPPNDQSYFDVVSLNETGRDRVNIIIHCWAPIQKASQSTQVHQGKYSFVLEAFSAESPSISRDFKMFVDGAGKLKVKAANGAR